MKAEKTHPMGSVMHDPEKYRFLQCRNFLQL